MYKLVVAFTKAAPAFFIKWNGYFFLFNRFGDLNECGKFHIKIAFTSSRTSFRLQRNHLRIVIKTYPIG